MDMTYKRNRLALSLVISIIAHITLLAFIAAIFPTDEKPLVPKSKKLIVEMFEGVVKKKTDPPEKVKRLAKENSVAKKEVVPESPPIPVKKTSQPSKAVSPIEQKTVESINENSREKTTNNITEPKEELSTDTDLPKPSIYEGLRIRDSKKNVKRLPTYNKLMPSYERLALQMPSADMPKDVEKGDAISLNTSEFKYISYFSKIKSRIQQVWRYPEAARMAGIKGVLTLKFVINRDGTLKSLTLLRSSGNLMLDSAAMEAIRDASPFYKVPDNLEDTLKIVANFEYALDGYY